MNKQDRRRLDYINIITVSGTCGTNYKVASIGGDLYKVELDRIEVNKFVASIEFNIEWNEISLRVYDSETQSSKTIDTIVTNVFKADDESMLRILIQNARCQLNEYLHDTYNIW